MEPLLASLISPSSIPTELNWKNPYIAIALAIVCVSFASIFIRWSGSSSLTIAFFRLLLATAMLSPFVIAEARDEIRSLSRREFALLAGVGVILAAHFALWITSLKVSGVTVASSVILVTSHPLFVAVASHFLLGERVSRSVVLGVTLGLFGVVTISLGDYGVSGVALGGDMLAFLGGTMAGLYILAGRRLRQSVSLPVYVFVVNGFSALSLFVLLLLVSGGPEFGVDIWREFALFILLAAVSQIGGHTLYNWSLRYVSAPFVSISLVGEPVGASILAWLLLKETPGLLAIPGGTLTLVGIYLTARSERAEIHP